MNRRSIQGMIRKVLRRRASDKLARLSEGIRQHAETGTMPADPVGQAYIKLSQTAIAAMDASIGGGPQHEAACRDFQEKYESWQRALQEVDA